MEDGLFYATFYMLDRQNGTEGGIAKLLGSSEAIDLSDKSWAYAAATVKKMTAALDASGIKYRLIYKVKYQGNGKNHMLTVGFEIKTKYVKTIIESNRTAEIKKEKTAMLYPTRTCTNRMFFPSQPEEAKPIAVKKASTRSISTPDEKKSIHMLYRIYADTKKVAERFPHLPYRHVCAVCAWA